MSILNFVFNVNPANKKTAGGYTASHIRKTSLQLGGATITLFDVGFGGIVKVSHQDLSYIRCRTYDIAHMSSDIYITTSMLWSIYYSEEFFFDVYILHRIRSLLHLHTTSHTFSPTSTYYIAYFLSYIYILHRILSLLHLQCKAEKFIGMTTFLHTIMLLTASVHSRNRLGVCEKYF